MSAYFWVLVAIAGVCLLTVQWQIAHDFTDINDIAAERAAQAKERAITEIRKSLRHVVPNETTEILPGVENALQSIELYTVDRSTMRAAASTYKSQPGRYYLAVLSATTSRGVGTKRLNGTPTFWNLIPSVLRTLNDTSMLRQVDIFMGFDEGDEFWDNDEVQTNAQTLFDKMKRRSGLTLNISLRFFRCQCHSMVCATNCIAKEAYLAGVDYFYRINDDTELSTAGWPQVFIKELLKMDPPNLGVVGPNCVSGNQFILTHDFTHRTHLEIFGFYYPFSFSNWWCDDWITKTYDRVGRMNKLVDYWIVHRKRKKRYGVGENPLDFELKVAKEVLNAYLMALAVDSVS